MSGVGMEWDVERMCFSVVLGVVSVYYRRMERGSCAAFVREWLG